MTIRSILSLSTILAAGAIASAPAHAQDATGFYGSLTAGAASVDNVKGTIYAPSFGDGEGNSEDLVQAAAIPAGSDTASGNVDLKSAFAISGSVGYDFGLIRADVEVSYAQNRVRSITVDEVNGSSVTLGEGDGEAICDFLEASDCSTSGNTVSFSGYKLRQLNALANVWVDIPTGTKFVPYVGGGIGISAFEVDGETDSGFAWQLGAGVAYHLTDGLAVTGDVRYRSANSVQFAYDEESGIALDRVKTWNYGLGLRYTF